MSEFQIFSTFLLCLGIFCFVEIKAQTPKNFKDIDHSLTTCEMFNEKSAALRADNEMLLERLQQTEQGLQEQLAQEIDVAKEIHEFKLKIQAIESAFLQRKSDSHKSFKDSVDSTNAKICSHKEDFQIEFQTFLKRQNILTRKFDIQNVDSNSNNNQLDGALENNEIFCENFYYRSLEALSGNVSILQNIDEKLKKVTENFKEDDLIKHKNTIDAMPNLIQQLNERETQRYCVRTKDKEEICTSQPYPSSCDYYDSSTHCSPDKCLIKNFIYGPEPFQVTCDHINEGGGWLIIQRRLNGSEDFERGWSEYKEGFGNLDGEFWLGLDKIHSLTATLAPVELLIQLTDHKDISKYAKYSDFAIGNETELYALTAVEGYEGNAGDSFSYHIGQKFSTKDKDNDKSASYNCAQQKRSAWWYKNCLWSNLNGFYYKDGRAPNSALGSGICWYRFHGYAYSLKSVQMMIRPRRNTSGDIESYQ